MFGQASSLFMRILVQLFLWFETMLVKGGALGAFVAAFFIFQVGRFLLGPIFGFVGSDKVRRALNGDSNE